MLMLSYGIHYLARIWGSIRSGEEQGLISMSNVGTASAFCIYPATVIEEKGTEDAVIYISMEEVCLLGMLCVHIPRTA